MYFGKNPTTESLDILVEESRRELIDKSIHADNYKSDLSKGKNRYERRVHSKVANSVKEFNAINMNKLFKENTLDVSIKVQGETDVYTVRIAFTSFLDHLHYELQQRNNVLDTGCIFKALKKAFNTDDVYIHCTCPDWKYRMDWWAHTKDIASTEEEDDPLQRGPDKTNPNDTKGEACKHVLLVINKTSWLIKVSSVVYNYINYMKKYQERLYADIIYPAIYQGKYEEPVQLSMFDDNDIVSIYNGKDLLYHGKEKNDPFSSLDWIEDPVSGTVTAKTVFHGKNVTLTKRTGEMVSNQEVIDTSNKWAATKNRFQKGNQSGIQFTKDDTGTIQGQQTFDFNSLMSDTEN